VAERVSFKKVSILLLAYAATVGFATLLRSSFAADSHHLTGRWAYNQQQSDDANQKVHDAEISERTQDRNSGGGYPGGGGGYPSGGGYPGGGYPGGGYPGGGGVGYPGGRVGIGVPGVGGMGRGRRGSRPTETGGPSSEQLEQLARNPKSLNITQDEKQIEITNDDGQITRLFPDDKKHKVSDFNGDEVTVKSHWDGDRLISESKPKHLGKLTETYELSSDGKQLFITSELDNSSFASPLIIRRVFDSATTVAKAEK
jgi:hypothetical protein